MWLQLPLNCGFFKEQKSGELLKWRYIGQTSAGINPYNLNCKNLTCSCLCTLECVWMKEQDCLISVLRRGEKKTPKPRTHKETQYLFYLGLFDLGYQKGHMLSFFVFCPRMIMEFLSVFLCSEVAISGLNKWKNTIKVDSAQKAWLCF